MSNKVLIADSEATGDVTDITFSSIPGNFRNLNLVVQARGDQDAAVTSVLIQFNGDTGSNYDYQYLAGQAANLSAAEAFAQAFILVGQVAANTAGAGIAGGLDITIHNYSGTTLNKGLSSLASTKTGTSTGNLLTWLIGGFWRNSAAITSIKIYPASDNFVAGTVASLYGLQ